VFRFKYLKQLKKMSKKILFLSLAIIIGISFFARGQFSLASDTSGAAVISSIQPSVTILSPNGGEKYQIGDTINISWSASDVPADTTVGLQLMYNLNGSIFEDVITPSDSSLDSKDEYSWVIPAKYSGNGMKSDWFKIRAILSGPNLPSFNSPQDYSDFYFTIGSSSTQPSVTIISPNGGETYKNDGNPITVKWQTNNVPTSQTFDIIRLRAYPNGQEYNLIYDVLNDGQEVITIPSSVPVGAYTLEIKTYVNGALAMDSSDSYFKIVDVFQNQSPITASSTDVNVKEQVKCVFKGATSEQKCYTATDSSNPYSGYACSGTESCVIDMKGINGDKITWKSSCGGYAYSVMDGSSDYAIFDCAVPVIDPFTTSTTATTPVAVNPTATAVEEKKEQIIDINEKSKLLSNNNFDFILAELNQLRSIIKEQQTEIKYLKSLVTDVKDLSEKSLSAINNFITYGVDPNTEKLGAGERAAVINSYKAAFDKLPETEAELADAIKIANGRFPSVTSDEAEKIANDQFVKIYKRVPDLSDANDNAAIKVMAYGLRQKAENRNLNSEKAGIQIFKNIFGTVPKTTEDWNTMQAITYSGATR